MFGSAVLADGSMDLQYFTLSISLRRVAEGYQVELSHSDPRSQAQVAPLRGGAAIDAPALQRLEAMHADYGKALARQLFADAAVVQRFVQVEAAAQAAGCPLRVLVCIDPSAPELQALRWELLRHPESGAALGTSGTTPLSRFMVSRAGGPVKLRARAELTALIAVSTPTPATLLGMGLAPVDFTGEVARVRAALGGIAVRTIGGPRSPCTLDRLIDELRRGIDIVYLVGHGVFQRGTGVAALILQDDAGAAKAVPGEALAARIGELQRGPRLAVLVPCQSAGDGRKLAAAGRIAVQATLAGRLADAGVPAVLAMQGFITKQTLAIVMPTFFSELQRDGQIDRALAVARGKASERSDAWMPALYSSLPAGCLWYTQGFHGGEDKDVWRSLLAPVARGKVVPILGPRLLEAAHGSSHDTARRLAAAHHYPMAAHEWDDLPRVTEYMGVKESRCNAVQAYRDQLLHDIIEHHRDWLPPGEIPPANMQPELGRLLGLVGAHLRENASEPHRILAELGASVYVTANFDPQLEWALEAHARTPQQVRTPWRYQRRPLGAAELAVKVPTARAPLVYHVFGAFGPEADDGLVLTESDYFDYLQTANAAQLIPAEVEGALVDNVLLFLGFRLTDWHFRLLLRLVMSLPGREKLRDYCHVAVQLDPDMQTMADVEGAKAYLAEYLGQQANINIFWGSSEGFLCALRDELAASGSIAVDETGLEDEEPGTSMTSRIADRNPFVGPRPIRQGEPLYGRDAEVRELYNQLQARRIVVLHSPAGAGKSSLVHAGLVPRLKAAGYDVWKPIRVNLDPGDLGVTLPTNRYALSAMLSLEDEQPADRQEREGTLARLDFLDYVEARPRRKSLADRPVVLIFEQFEEILTVAPREIEAKRAFFAALGRALDTGKYWALFLLREDYLGGLAPYRDLIPTQMANTFRLDLLGLQGAAEVAVKLAERGGRSFPAVDQLVRDLSAVKVPQPDGSFVTEPGLHVEPVQLQVACRRIWAAMPEGERSIGIADIAKYGEGSTSLANYYADTVRIVADGARAVERDVRAWVGQRLIVAGVRAQVRQEAGRSAGLDNRLVLRLCESDLVHREQRAGETWFELSHDRLIEPIQADNLRWERANLHPLQIQARLWEDGLRNRGLLLGAGALPGATQWAQDNPALITEGEREFLAESRKERLKDVSTRWGLLMSSMVAVCVALFVAAQGVMVWLARAEAVAQRDAAEAARVAGEQATLAAVRARVAAEAAGAEALKQRDTARAATMMAGARQLLASGQPGLAALVAVEVRQPESIREWRELALSILARPFPELTLGPVKAADLDGDRFSAWSPDGTRILTISDDTATVWNAYCPGTPFVRIGAAGAVRLAAWSPDGSRIVTASHDNKATVRGVDGWGEALVLEGHEGFVLSAAWSPDGHRIVTTSRDRTARVWNVDGPGAPLTLAGHLSAVVAAAWSPDGQRIVTASRDKTARVWNGDGSGVPLVLRGHEGAVQFVAWSPDGLRILTASADHTARIWRVDGSASPGVLEGLLRGVVSAAWSPDGRHILTASLDNMARVWSADGQGPPFIVNASENDRVSTNFAAAWSPDGRRIVTTASDGAATIWNSDGGGAPVVLAGPERAIGSASWSPDGQRILTTSRDHLATVWKVDRPGAPVVLDRHEKSVLSATWSPDGQRILTASEDTTARIWSADGSGVPAILGGHEGAVWSAAWSPDGDRILTASADKTARIWSADGAGAAVVLEGHASSVVSAAWSPDGEHVVTASADKTARVWDADGPGAPLVFAGHTDSLLVAAWSPSGQRIVTASADRTARIWNADGTGAPSVLEGHANSVVAAAWSPDGARIVTASADKTARVWSADGSRAPVILKGHEEPVLSTAWSPDGARIVTASSDQTARVWSADGSGANFILGVHEGHVNNAAWSPDGEHIVTASSDNTVRVWSADAPGASWLLTRHGGAVLSAAWSPDGKRLLTASEDRTAKVWIFDIDLLKRALRDATAECLSPEQRRTYLLEDSAAAADGYLACKREAGRGSGDAP
jgi:WD40 repeat protein